jgi:DNA-binding CsgD family transcriptional regulator
MPWSTQPFERAARLARTVLGNAGAALGARPKLLPTDIAPAEGVAQQLNQPLSLAMRYIRLAARLNERGLAGRQRITGALLAAGVQLVRMGSIIARLQGPLRRSPMTGTPVFLEGLPGEAILREEGGTPVLPPPADAFATLTRREREVLRGMVAGQPNKVTARELGISSRTIEAYRANVMAKTGAKSLSELVTRCTVEKINRDSWRDAGGAAGKRVA